MRCFLQSKHASVPAGVKHKSYAHFLSENNEQQMSKLLLLFCLQSKIIKITKQQQ